MVAKEKNFEKWFLLFSAFLVTMISIPIIKHQWKPINFKGKLITNNDALSQYELLCLYLHLLGSWSATMKATRLQIKGYLLIFLYSKEYISITDSKASDGLELNWCCHYDHYVDACQKNKKQKKTTTTTKTNSPQSNKHVYKYFQTATALKHRNAKLKLYPH